MRSINHIFTLFKKDLLLEIRQQYSFYGVLLYIGATIFVLYMAIESPESNVWNGFFWVIQIIYFGQCSGKKFFAGKSRADALFLFDRRTPGFCISQTFV